MSVDEEKEYYRTPPGCDGGGILEERHGEERHEVQLHIRVVACLLFAQDGNS